MCFGHLLKKYVFSVAGLTDSHGHEGFIYTNTDQSEMNSEGLIDHDHPSRADENLARVPNLS